MSRSKWKSKLLWLKYKESKRRYVVFNPHFEIMRDFVGTMCYLYDGRKYKKLVITNEMVGFHLSDFVLTRFNDGGIHDRDKKKKRNKKK